MTRLLVVLAAALLAGCVEMAAIGIGAAILSSEDRRSTTMQVTDEELELRVSNRLKSHGDRVHVNVTSFNRYILLTGEAANANLKAEVEKIAWELPTKPQGVTNEIRVAGNTSLGDRSNDTFITGKIKARFLDARKFNAMHVKVVTEKSVVYLMGIVTEAEANAAVDIARTTGGVTKVVKVFEPYCQPTDALCRPRGSAKDDADKPKAGT